MNADQSALGQEARARLGGRVIDAQGSVVPSAEVVVTSDDTDISQRTVTNEQGNWLIQFLVPGRYHFTVSARGLRKVDRQGITLQTSDDKAIDVQLELGAITQSVEVTAEAPLIDTSTATSGTVISGTLINEIPSVNRVPTLLAVLSPGVVQQDQNNNTLHGWSYYGASQFSAGGGRNNIYSNYYTLDGFPNVKSGGYVAFLPSPDLLSEFRVQLNAYDASTGREAGSAINMTTKSGTKDYHGNLYEFNQNTFMNAQPFQNNISRTPLQPVHLNIYGATFGGPVWLPKLYNGKKKTFFFVSWEGLRNQNPNGGISSVPTALERQGDFSQSFTTVNQAGQRVRFPYTIYDPSTVDAKGNRMPFTGDVIPTNRINPIALNLLKFVPLPNTAGDGTSNSSNNYIEPSIRQDKMAFFSGRGDQQWSDNHRSFLVLRWDTNHELQGSKFQNASTGTYSVRTPKVFGLDHVWTVSPNKVVDFRFSINRYEELTYNSGVGFDPTQLGFSPSVAKTFLYPQFPQIIGVASNFGVDTNTYTMNSYYTWSASLSHVHGNHMFRYGVEYWVLQQSNASYGAQPQIDFSNVVWTRQNNLVSGGTGNGNSMSQFLLGLPSGGIAPFNASEIWSQHFTSLYLQDDWRVTPKLTANFGLRWDYERPVTERYNRLTSNFDPTAINPVSTGAQAAYAQIAANNPSNTALQQLLQIVPVSVFQVRGVQRFAGVDGQSTYAVQPDYHEFQPRIGFAYRLGSTTVIRGGVGRFTIASWESGNQNGFSITTNLNASNDNFITPAATLSNPFPGGLTQPTGSTLGPLTNLGNGGIGWANQNPNRPHSWQYSLTIQQQFKSWLFEVGYAHNKTSGLWVSQNQNLPSFAVWQKMNQVQFDATGRPQDTLLYNAPVPNPFQNLTGVSPAAGVYKNSTVNAGQLARPVTILGDITENDMPLGRNQWDALVAKVERRFSHGFGVINAFTWSKMLEDITFLGPQNLGILEHRLADQDRPFHLSVAPVWEIPVGRGKAFGNQMPKLLDAVAGGWELAGQYTIQSGTPVYFASNPTNGNFFFSGNNFSLPRGQRTFDRWFDTTQFVPYPLKNTDISAYPAWTDVQNLPGANYKPTASDSIRNGVYQDFANWVRTIPTAWSSERADRVNEFNIGLYKNFHPTEWMRAQFRFETFNTMNHPRFGAPNTDPNSSQFGTVQKLQQNAARAIEMALKVYF